MINKQHKCVVTEQIKVIDIIFRFFLPYQSDPFNMIEAISAHFQSLFFISLYLLHFFFLKLIKTTSSKLGIVFIIEVFNVAL